MSRREYLRRCQMMPEDVRREIRARVFEMGMVRGEGYSAIEELNVRMNAMVEVPRDWRVGTVGTLFGGDGRVGKFSVKR